MRLRIHRSDGRTGTYHQDSGSRAQHLARLLDPYHLFNAGPIVIGVHNPFNVLNPDEVCWIEVESDVRTEKLLPGNIDRITLLGSREEYEAVLAHQWPLWMKFRKSEIGDPLEALVDVSLRSGESLFLRVTGTVSDINLVDAVFGMPAITATAEPDRTIYINPKCIIRSRIYHSKDRVNYPFGIWVAEADDI